MDQLNKYIKSTVERNKRNADNTELNDLVNSNEYTNVVDKMKDIKENIRNLKDYLNYSF